MGGGEERDIDEGRRERETWPLRYLVASAPYLFPGSVGYDTHATCSHRGTFSSRDQAPYKLTRMSTLQAQENGHLTSYRGTSLIRPPPPVGPFSTPFLMSEVPLCAVLVSRQRRVRHPGHLQCAFNEGVRVDCGGRRVRNLFSVSSLSLSPLSLSLSSHSTCYGEQCRSQSLDYCGECAVLVSWQRRV